MNYFKNKILEMKLNEFIKIPNQNGGEINKINSNNPIELFMGIIFLIVGIFIYKNKFTWASTEGKIIESIENSDFTYKINFTYEVDTIKYNKLLIINKMNFLFNPENKSNIKLYYLKSDPNIVKLQGINHDAFGIGLTLMGIIAIGYFLYNLTNSNEGKKTSNDIELYSKLSTKNDLNIFYSK